MNTRLTIWVAILMSVMLMSGQACAADNTAVGTMKQGPQAVQTKSENQAKESKASKPKSLTKTAEAKKPGSGPNDQSGLVATTNNQNSVFKNLLYQVWSRLRALSPRPTNAPEKHPVVTAGIRGAETTTSLIHPYWKDDRTQDPEYIKELAEYTHARQIAEKGDLTGAIKAFSNFIDAHGKSELKPDAQFALGLSYAGAGDKEKSVTTLKTFMKQYPKHPLVADAQQVIDQINK